MMNWLRKLFGLKPVVPVERRFEALVTSRDVYSKYEVGDTYEDGRRVVDGFFDYELEKYVLVVVNPCQE